MEVVPARVLNMLYIYLDIGFLVLFFGVLLFTRRYMAAIVGAIGGLLYFLVDYGGFYLLLGTREVVGADPFWFLLWMSISYGVTNFAWIWLWLDGDGHKLEWSLFIMSGWMCTALLSQSFGAGFAEISIRRGTTAYHGLMGVFLFVGYGLLCVQNIRAKKAEDKAPILQILLIGMLVQGSWEFILLITGIRPAGFGPLLVDTLLETNMGLPYLYWIHKAVMGRRQEDLRTAAAARAANSATLALAPEAQAGG